MERMTGVKESVCLDLNLNRHEVAVLKSQVASLIHRCAKVERETRPVPPKAVALATPVSAHMNLKTIHTVEDLVDGMREEFSEERFELDVELQRARLQMEAIACIDRGMPTHRERFNEGVRWCHMQALPTYEENVTRGRLAAEIAPRPSLAQALELDWIYALQAVKKRALRQAKLGLAGGGPGNWGHPCWINQQYFP